MDRQDYTTDLSKLEKVEIDFSDESLPPKARKLKPNVFSDGGAYCCLFGPDPQVGIFGCGDTPQEAINDWENDLNERIIHLAEGDHLAKSAIDTMGGTNE